MLAYRGMPIFHDWVNLPVQLWIAARGLQAACLVLALLLKNRQVNDAAIVAGFSAATLLLLLAAFSGHFPNCYIEGEGLTSFKINAEYVISFVLTISLVILYRSRWQFEDRVARLILISVVCTILSELAFTHYATALSPLNILGHYLKLAAFYFIYRSILTMGLREPFALVFRDLKQTQQALSDSIEALEERVRERTADLQLANARLEEELGERLRAEQEIRQLNAELEDRVRLRTTRLKAANEELESFCYTISHDLRAPLRHINSFARMLLEEHGAELPANEQTLLVRIEKGAQRMAGLIDGSLKLSRVGRQEVLTRTVSLGALAKEVVDELSPDWTGRNIEWKIGSLPTVSGDPNLLHQVFQNLIANALKFSRTRSLAVIEIGEMVENGSHILYVRDNGAGFDMRYADKLFRPFQRLHRAEEFEGTGIGLATVKRIVQRYGGRIWAESKVGEGSTFYFTCPPKHVEQAVSMSTASP